MKRQIAAVFMAVCVGFVAVPASAQPAPPYQHWKKDHRHDRRDRRDDNDNAGAAVAGAIFGAIAGAIVSDAQRKNAPPPPPPEYGAYCNYNACANRYRSFRSSDCTYQPYHGPRRYCRL
ncbi:BA14K family protein [uncultured Cohaesibacter sp.]|uniref:BA14K family protein n=1 Tax=uncultured Cohaesibacter sp. TaxID=1002546 RepID=UPI0029C86A5C|nr:BA14K family protein [uncultured Cohaesibacter sp.]